MIHHPNLAAPTVPGRFVAKTEHAGDAFDGPGRGGAAPPAQVDMDGRPTLTDENPAFSLR